MKLGALSVRLVRLWVNPALTIWAPVGRGEREQLPSPGNVPWKCFCAAKIANILQMGIMGFTYSVFQLTKTKIVVNEKVNVSLTKTKTKKYPKTKRKNK